MRELVRLVIQIVAFMRLSGFRYPYKLAKVWLRLGQLRKQDINPARESDAKTYDRNSLSFQ